MVVYKMTLVFSAITPCKFSLTFHSALSPLSLILFSVRIHYLPSTLYLIFPKISVVHIPVSPFNTALSMLLSLIKVTFVCGTVALL